MLFRLVFNFVVGDLHDPGHVAAQAGKDAGPALAAAVDGHEGGQADDAVARSGAPAAQDQRRPSVTLELEPNLKCDCKLGTSLRRTWTVSPAHRARPLVDDASGANVPVTAHGLAVVDEGAVPVGYHPGVELAEALRRPWERCEQKGSWFQNM